MTFTFIEKDIKDITADFEIILVIDKNLEHKFILDREDFDFLNYDGTSTLVLAEKKRIYLACKNAEADNIRKAVASAYNAIKTYKISSLKIATYKDGACPILPLQAIVEGFILGSYCFDKYKSKKENFTLKEVKISQENYFEADKIEAKQAELAIKHGEIMAKAVNFAKDKVNETPEHYTPLTMAEDALALAKNNDKIECQIFDEDFLKKENMNAFLAVNRSSALPPRLIHLSYKPANSSKKIVLVGKGLTYDCGGLSLKPSDSMLTMKSDKSGAIAAMSIIKAAAELELPFEIHSILGATENMIGGNSFKPDDVLIARNGLSIEVRNTDAEGRLVLADCLSYAQDLEPDLLIDLATLTGACVVGLGQYNIGIMGNNVELMNDFREKGKRSGELSTILEFNDYLRETVKSKIADIANIASSRYGGAITAGIFLDHFIKEENKDKWLHLDIAGPAYNESPWGYNQAGATGASIRMILYFLRMQAMQNCKHGEKKECH